MPSGYYTSQLEAVSPGLAVSAGAEAQSNGSGRLVAALFPAIGTGSTRGLTKFYSKDHVYPDTGNNVTYVMTLRAQ